MEEKKAKLEKIQKEEGIKLQLANMLTEIIKLGGNFKLMAETTEDQENLAPKLKDAAKSLDSIYSDITEYIHTL